MTLPPAGGPIHVSEPVDPVAGPQQKRRLSTLWSDALVLRSDVDPDAGAFHIPHHSINGANNR